MKRLTIIIVALMFSMAAQAACDIKPAFSYKTKGLTVSFTNKTQGAFTNVEWTLGDGNTSNESNPKYTYSEPGMKVFTITVSNADGCSETFSGKVYVFNISSNNVVTINNAEQEEEASTTKTDVSPVPSALASKMVRSLISAPNPAVAQTTISFDLSESTEVLLRIFDSSGKLVSVLANEQMLSGRQEFPFQRNNLAGGTYVVSVATPTETSTSKLVLI